MDGGGKRQRLAGADGADALVETRQRNSSQHVLVTARLSEQMPPGVALDGKLAELASIVAACDRAGLEFATFGALDELMAGMDRDQNLGAVVSVGDEEAPTASSMLTLVGRYCQLWERPALALGHFRKANEVAKLSGRQDSGALAGVQSCSKLLAWRSEAVLMCTRWWSRPHSAPPYFNASGLQSFQEMVTVSSDVIIASYPKCGTSWLHQILFSLLRMDEHGCFSKPLENLCGGQVSFTHLAHSTI